jgi:polyphosphate kinase 2
MTREPDEDPGKNAKPNGGEQEKPDGITRKKYRRKLRRLQVELVRLQRHLIRQDRKLLVILEGRDAAGKDGTIKRIVRHLSPRDTRVWAPGKPSDRDRSSWYFQRFVPHLPAGQEMVLFNRSWYNRAGVERVMGFATDAEYIEFFVTVTEFESMLVRSGITLFKYYLDISREEQARRLEARRHDPLKQWKISPVDEEALARWTDYTEARNEMFRRSHRPGAPWTIVAANDKRLARIHLIRDLLQRMEYEGKSRSIGKVDPEIVFSYDDLHLHDGRIAH